MFLVEQESTDENQWHTHTIVFLQVNKPGQFSSFALSYSKSDINQLCNLKLYSCIFLATWDRKLPTKR